MENIADVLFDVANRLELKYTNFDVAVSRKTNIFKIHFIPKYSGVKPFWLTINPSDFSQPSRTNIVDFAEDLVDQYCYRLTSC